MKMFVNEVPFTPLCFVAHSNGTNIAVNAMQRLASMGEPTETCILIGSAVESDVEKSGLLELFEKGMLQRCVAYVSNTDEVIRPLKWMPGKYGDLGVVGFQYKKNNFGVRLKSGEKIPDEPGFYVREFPDAGHSGYFRGLQLIHTFDQVKEDLGLTDEPIRLPVEDHS